MSESTQIAAGAEQQEYFLKKKSELADLCLKASPEKETPLPLIDKSITFDSIRESLANSALGDESVLNITELEKMISASDNTLRIADYIAKMGNKDAPKISFESSTDKTSSSLECLPNGKLPIETNKIELVWGCICIGHKKVQTFILRNKSQNKLRLQIVSSNANFRILSDNFESGSVAYPILMYPSESRSFTITFTPTSVGAVVGKLNFSPISTELQLQQTKRQKIMLYGYGGHSIIRMEGVMIDTNMKMWLSFGKLDNHSQLSQKITIRNAGSVAAFGCINFETNAVYGSKVTVLPTQLVLQPKEQAVVSVTYTPTKEDAKDLFMMTPSEVIEIGHIQVVTGEEPVRGRIRRLYGKLKQEGGMTGDPLMERLSRKFSNEKMPTDLSRFTETVGSVKDLMQTFQSNEIILTVEKDSENSLLGQIGGIDETSMFHSLSEGMVNINASKTLVSSCIVEPNKLVLIPPGKIEDWILITSLSTASLQFVIIVSPPDILQIKPTEGILAAGETTLIKISCNTSKLQN